MKLARCARSDSHSVRALRSVKSSPYGVGLRSNGRGSWTSSCLLCIFRRCGLMRIAICFNSLRAVSDAMLTVKYAGADPHTSRHFTACPWKICVAAFASPLFVALVLTRCGRRPEIAFSITQLEILCCTLSRASIELLFHLMKQRAHIRQETFLVICRPASYVCDT